MTLELASQGAVQSSEKLLSLAVPTKVGKVRPPWPWPIKVQSQDNCDGFSLRVAQCTYFVGWKCILITLNQSVLLCNKPLSVLILHVFAHLQVTLLHIWRYMTFCPITKIFRHSSMTFHRLRGIYRLPSGRAGHSREVFRSFGGLSLLIKVNSCYKLSTKYYGLFSPQISSVGG
jgi:hypothetical protein